MEVKVAREKKSETFAIAMKRMTKGELLSLVNGMTEYADHSPVAQDVLDYLNAALKEASIDI
jgi:hypothetical protein